MQNRLIITIIVSLLAFAVGLGMYFSQSNRNDKNTGNSIAGLLWPNPKQILPFNTIDHTGTQFGLEQLIGQWSFLFFGYTNCPDVCPITLSVMNNVHKRLEKQNLELNAQTIFISVDPDRDTTEQLKTYVNYFNPEFIGLGGTSEQITSLTRQIGIAYMHGEKTSNGEYSVDHSASVFLVDPMGRLVAIFSAPQQVDDVLQRFLAIQSFIQDHG
jgi:protein SCO1/2